MVFSVIGALVCSVIWYLVMLPLRKIINETALNKGLLFRESSKVCDRDTFEPYDFFTDLAEHINGGVGLLLHFKWQQTMIVWTVMVLVVLAILQCFFNTRPSAIKHDPGTPESFKACELDLHKQEHNFVWMEKVYFFVTLLIYILTTVGCLTHAVYQRRRSKQMSDKAITQGDYALFASGFPCRPGSEDVEGEIQAFFEQAFPDKGIVGVSVCWDFHEQLSKDWVKDVNEADLQTLDNRFEFARGMQVVSNRSEESGEQNRSCCDVQLRCLDGAFGIGPHLLETGKTDGAEERVQTIMSSGFAFVVFNTERQCQEALKESQKSPLKFNNEEIGLQHLGVEPETVLWNNYGFSQWVRLRNIVIGVICIFFSVIILDIFFYAPYVVYIQTYSSVKGKVGGDFLQGTLLGLLITVCNQIIYQVIGVIAELCGFTRYGRKLQFYVIAYTVSVLFNTCLDLWTVMLLAQGMTEGDVVSDLKNPAEAMGGHGILSPKSLAEHPGVQRSVYTQLLTYLFPGCLLIPFLLEPLVTNFLSYWLPVWLVRSRREVSKFEAEQRLAAPPYDLSRYGDIIVNIMLCVLALFFTYRDLYLVFVWLLASLLIIYCWDHVRYLRCSQRCYFASGTLDVTKDYLMAFPCAVMAASMVFRVWAASDEGFLEEMSGVWKDENNYAMFLTPLAVLTRKTIVNNIATAFLVHLMIHFLLLHHWVPYLGDVGESHDDEVPYAQMAEHTPCNWFTANPVHCLRSKYFFKHEPPCTPYMVGKEYLMQPNHAVGLFYKTKREDIMQFLELRAATTGFRSLGLTKQSTQEDVNPVEQRSSTLTYSKTS